MNRRGKLKTGFTTGACAAAAARAARMALLGRKVPSKIGVLFPDGKVRRLPVESAVCSGSVAVAKIVKYAGDDPDVTDGAVVSAKVSVVSRGDSKSADHIEKAGVGFVVIRGGTGVGIVTRPGLDVPVGKCAVNPVPRRMLAENLNAVRKIGKGEFLLVEIGIGGGARLAKRTLNPTLGVVGGLSVLGTSGIVYPYSNKAYIDTVKVLLRGCARTGVEHVVLCTGGRTANLSMADYPDLPEHAFIRIGDFIGESLCEAAKYKFQRVTVACMPGKAFKYRMGLGNTHAHRAELEIAVMRPDLEACGVPESVVASVMKAATVREVLEILPKRYHVRLMDVILEGALRRLGAWFRGAGLGIVCYGNDGRKMGALQSK